MSEAPTAVAAAREIAPQWPRGLLFDHIAEDWADLARLGTFAMAVPVAAGGLDLGLSTQVVVSAELGAGPVRGQQVIKDVVDGDRAHVELVVRPHRDVRDWERRPDLPHLL